MSWQRVCDNFELKSYSWVSGGLGWWSFVCVLSSLFPSSPAHQSLNWIRWRFISWQQVCDNHESEFIQQGFCRLRLMKKWMFVSWFCVLSVSSSHLHEVEIQKLWNRSVTMVISQNHAVATRHFCRVRLMDICFLFNSFFLPSPALVVRLKDYNRFVTITSSKSYTSKFLQG